MLLVQHVATVILSMAWSAAVYSAGALLLGTMAPSADHICCNALQTGDPLQVQRVLSRGAKGQTGSPCGVQWRY